VKERGLTFPEIGLIAGTRGMLGAGLALLVGGRLDPQTRRALGWTLFLIGALSSVPLIAHVLHKPSLQGDAARAAHDG
jgi:hypothetical protein